MATIIANRYAVALADVVAQAGDYPLVLKELQDFAAVYQESAELQEALLTPAISQHEKEKVLEAILARLEVSPTTSRFLRVLLANYRMNLLEKVVEAFRKVVNQRLGIVVVEISSAQELSEGQRQALSTAFQELTNHKVELKFSLKPELLGGILAQIDSTVYDGTVRGRLEQVREQLLAR